MEYVELRIFYRNSNILCRVVLKTFCTFAKRIISKRSRKFFSIITKSPGLNHPGISAVSGAKHNYYCSAPELRTMLTRTYEH
jgi:hypothetical protein